MSNNIKNVALASTSSFGDIESKPINLLSSNNLEFIPNPYKRNLSESEISELLDKHKPIGLLAGTELITRSVLESAKAYLKVISRVGVGWENIDHTAAKELGIKIFRTENAVTQSVVELTIGLFFDLARKISAQDRAIRSGIWKKQMGNLITGKQLGVVGCGRIGKKVAISMKTLGCHVVSYDPYPDKEWHRLNGVMAVDSLEKLFQTSDLISIHAAYSEGLSHFVNETLLSLAKPNLLIVNASRGEMIDEAALYSALKSERIAGAALDVFENEPYSGPLINLENVILTPHIGSYAKEARLEMEIQAVESLLEGIKD